MKEETVCENELYIILVDLSVAPSNELAHSLRTGALEVEHCVKERRLSALHDGHEFGPVFGCDERSEAVRRFSEEVRGSDRCAWPALNLL